MLWEGECGESFCWVHKLSESFDTTEAFFSRGYVVAMITRSHFGVGGNSRVNQSAVAAPPSGALHKVAAGRSFNLRASLVAEFICRRISFSIFHDRRGFVLRDGEDLRHERSIEPGEVRRIR